MRSKVDFTTIINQNEEKEEEEAEKINETAMETDVMKSKEENLTTTDDQICSLNEEKNDSKVGQTNTKEGSGMLKELEASSKGKVKGSLLLSYFKSSNQPYMLVMMIVTFLLAQALASIADVWVSYWYVQKDEIHAMRKYFLIQLISTILGLTKKKFGDTICSRIFIDMQMYQMINCSQMKMPNRIYGRLKHLLTSTLELWLYSS